MRQNQRIQTVLIIGLITAGNVLLIFPLFIGGYTQFISAIDGVFIADARFISQNWPYTSWNPLWYSGFPFDLFYTPLLPYLLAFIHQLSSNAYLVSDLYRIVSGFFYVLAPISLYLFVRKIFHRQLPAVMTALAYSLLPSFAYFIPEVFQDALPFNLVPWQLQIITRYADTPHMAGLALIPVTSLLFLKTLRESSYKLYIATSILIMLIALFNWIAFFALIMILAIVLLSEMLQSEPWTKLKRSFYCAGLSYGFIAFWYTIDFVQASLAFGGRGVTPLMSIFISLLAVIIGAITLPFLLQNTRIQPLFIVSAWFLLFFTVISLRYSLDITLVPQPERFLPELNMAASMLVGVAITKSYDQLKTLVTPQSPQLLSLGFMILIGLCFCAAFLSLVEPSRNITRAHEDITQTTEYQVSHWLSAHTQPGERVYATGSHSFWLNAFSDVPQIAGGATQASTNVWWEAVSYNIDHYPDGLIAILWARAFNVKYIVVNQPNSQVPYKNFLYPDKFEGLLKHVYELDGDVIYEVPLANPSLAQVVNVDVMNGLQSPESVIDYTLEDYLQVVDQNTSQPTLKITRLDSSELVMNVSVTEKQAIHLQMTYDIGWEATSNDGDTIPIEPDVLGFIVLFPRPGEQIIRITHTSSNAVYSGRILTAFTVLILIIHLLRTRFIKKIS